MWYSCQISMPQLILNIFLKILKTTTEAINVLVGFIIGVFPSKLSGPGFHFKCIDVHAGREWANATKLHGICFQAQRHHMQWTINSFRWLCHHLELTPHKYMASYETQEYSSLFKLRSFPYRFGIFHFLSETWAIVPHISRLHNHYFYNCFVYNKFEFKLAVCDTKLLKCPHITRNFCLALCLLHCKDLLKWKYINLFGRSFVSLIFLEIFNLIIRDIFWHLLTSTTLHFLQ